MKKVFCFVLALVPFFVCSSIVMASTEGTQLDGLIAEADDNASSDSESSNSGSGGNRFDASWENGDPIIVGSDDCTTIFKNSDGSFNDFGKFIQDIFTLIKFAAPILVIAFSTIDYAKAISAQNADDIKKANGKFVKRLVAGVAVFLLPFILDFIFDIFGLYGLGTCGIR